MNNSDYRQELTNKIINQLEKGLLDKGFEKEKILSVNNVAGNQKFEQQKTSLDNITTNFAITDIRLMVDFNRRQEAKELGAKWDKDLKTWYAPKGENLDKFKELMGEKIVNLRDMQVFALYEEKSEIKNFGGFWNNDKKGWYITAGSDIKNIPNKFFVEHEKSADKAPIMEKEGFADFAKSNGLLLEGEPIADGKFHRVPVEGGKLNSKDGSYVYFDDASGKAGWIKNFKTGVESSFGESGINSEGVIRRLPSEEIKARQEERQSEYNEAAKKAKYLVEKVFKKAEAHPYLETKGVKAHNAVIDKEGALIIPLRNIEGEIRTFQRILADGTKGYMKGGEKSGSYFSFGSPKDKMLICEGFATGASIYEATKIPTIAAMDTGNLERVAVDMRNKYGERMNITIAADNDHMTKDNPGMKYAQKAADAAGSVVIYPNFTEVEKAQKLTDFNDIAVSRGNKEVKHQILEQNKNLAEKTEKQIL